MVQEISIVSSGSDKNNSEVIAMYDDGPKKYQKTSMRRTCPSTL
jgi:hypothetical protein